jgi:hypothetical protein
MSPPSLLASQSSQRCIDVAADVATALFAIEIAPGVFAPGGALPVAVTLGEIQGLIRSEVVSFTASGQGAQHYTLRHLFESNLGTFVTEAKGPAGGAPNVCRVNDVAEIASGTRIFTNADGSFRSHGEINLNDFTISVHLTGRVCVDLINPN